MTPTQHFSASFARERLPGKLDFLDTLVSQMMAGQDRLSRVLNFGIDAAGCATVVSNGMALRKSLDLAAEAGAGLFELSVVPVGEQHEIGIARRSVILHGTGPLRVANRGKWLNSFYAAMARRRSGELTRLVNVDERVVDQPAVSAVEPPFLRAWDRCLRATWSGKPVAPLLIEALDKADADKLDGEFAEWALFIVVPLMKMLDHVVEPDGPAFHRSPR